METVIKTTTKRAEKLMNWALNNSQSFLTGNPIKLNHYYVKDNKATLAQFTTERGIEDLILKPYDCLLDCWSDADKKIIIKGNHKNAPLKT